MEIAEFLLDKLLNFYYTSETHSKRIQAINSMFYVNKYGLNALHILCMCNDNCSKKDQQRKLKIMHNILNKLTSEGLKFIVNMNKCKPIFINCNYNICYNTFYKEVACTILQSKNNHIRFFKKQKYKDILIINKNIELLLFFATTFKDFFDYKLILIAIKLCNINEFLQIISFNQRLAVNIINTNFTQVFNVLITSVDDILTNNVYEAISQITQKINLLFCLAHIHESDTVKIAKCLYEAIKYYTRYRCPHPIREANFMSWVNLYIKHINQLALTEKQCKTIINYLSDISLVLFGVRSTTKLPTSPQKLTKFLVPKLALPQLSTSIKKLNFSEPQTPAPTPEELKQLSNINKIPKMRII